MKVMKYGQYNISVDMAETFINYIFTPKLNESEKATDKPIDNMLASWSKDLKFNFGLVFTFGAGVKSMFPIIENLIRNKSINIDMSLENIVLLTLAVIAITYLQESGNAGGNDKVTKKDAQSILEELRLRGIGNGIVRQLVSCFRSITNILKILFKNTPYIINGLVDMFKYTALLIPTMNAISALVGTYDLNMDTLPGNFLSLGIGITTFLAKSGLNFLYKKLKDKFKINIATSHLDVPSQVRPYEISDGDTDIEIDSNNKLIKEQ